MNAGRELRQRRAVITGLGAVTPLGNDLATTVTALDRGRSAVEAASLLDPPGLDGTNAATVRDFDARPSFRDLRALKLTDRRTRFAVAAAAMALADARIEADSADREGIAVLVGASGFDLEVAELARAIGADPEGRAAHDLRFFAERLLARASPLWPLAHLLHMLAAHVSIQLGLAGGSTTLTGDWVAGSQAIGEALRLVETGEAEVVLAGGADTGLLPLALAGYAQGGVFAAGDEETESFAPGEGAAFLVVEERQRALRRGARPYGEIVGYAAASAPPPTVSGPNALDHTMRAALDEAGWSLADLGAVLSAGVASPLHRGAERAALSRLSHELERPFDLAPIPVVDLKPLLGHALAAAGPIDLAVILRSPGDGAAPRLLCNAFGFLGQAVSLTVMRK